ncbi:uncharacterized protein [Medicago truncatula]|uniref:uncharacterized protein n=1 Tax=Medicago truncatula TaxID=3880 RepID=UPI000D2F27CB|nr:uncharacterized protein LOC112417381 [Medicago truncatula]
MAESSVEPRKEDDTDRISSLPDWVIKLEYDVRKASDCTTGPKMSQQAKVKLPGTTRNSDADCLLCFAENVGPENAYFAELAGAMRAIDIAYQNNWMNLWLELDYALVVNAFKNNSEVPWKLRNRWNNYINKTKSMTFIASHVFREG